MTLLSKLALSFFPIDCLGFINSSGGAHYTFALLRWALVPSNWTYLIDVGGSSLKADAYRFDGSQSISLAYASPV